MVRMEPEVGVKSSVRILKFTANQTIKSRYWILITVTVGL
jgi:hypothetical protein